MGVHISKIKNLTMDTWTKEQVEPMKSIGNVNSNAIYNPNEVRNPPPPNLMDAERDSELEQYIRCESAFVVRSAVAEPGLAKYQFKRFINKSAFVSSKLGPSRSSATVSSSGGPPMSNGGVPATSSRPLATQLNSAISTSSVSTLPLQSQAQRRSTLASASPAALTSASQQPQQPQVRSQTLGPQAVGTPTTNNNGVWADLISLQTPSASSSLPLQYQTPTQTPLGSAYQTSMVPGINPFQQQHIAANPYSQQLYPATGLQNSSFSTGTPLSTSTTQPQSFFSTQQSLPSAPVQTTNFYQPQPQQALQVQVPNPDQALFSANNGLNLGQGGFVSAPATQSHFLSTSPAQYPSQSPQPMNSATPQPHMFSTTPQPQMFTTTPQPHPQFMTTPSQQFQMQQQGGLGVGSYLNQSQQNPLSMTMGQQNPYGVGAFQQQSMQLSGQFGTGFQQPASQPFSAGFTGGQTWGAL
ncbi:hypothetical protein H0H92_001966 [Tricholoma furcatifolium]|nr:hypothetical protein H0H92_001966 [Tricholoma furcatifolium]